MLLRVRMSEDRHPDLFAERFDDLGQQREAAKLGWDLPRDQGALLQRPFPQLHGLPRSLSREPLRPRAGTPKCILGGANTAMLLVGGTLMALALRAAQLGQQRPLVWLLLATASLGVLFIGVKASSITGLQRASAARHHFLWGEANLRRRRALLVALLCDDRACTRSTSPSGSSPARARLAHASQEIHESAGTCRSKSLASTGSSSISSGSSFPPCSTSQDIVDDGFIPRAPTGKTAVTSWRLLALTWTFGYVNLGVFDLVAALGISFAKMILIALFHAFETGEPHAASRRWHGLSFLLLMLTLSLADYLSPRPGHDTAVCVAGRSESQVGLAFPAASANHFPCPPSGDGSSPSE